MLLFFSQFSCLLKRDKEVTSYTNVSDWQSEPRGSLNDISDNKVVFSGKTRWVILGMYSISISSLSWKIFSYTRYTYTTNEHIGNRQVLGNVNISPIWNWLKNRIVNLLAYLEHISTSSILLTYDWLERAVAPLSGTLRIEERTGQLLSGPLRLCPLTHQSLFWT